MLAGIRPRDVQADARSVVIEPAPAKINLALHVTGRRSDGYHLLESIVTFADIGDRLSFSPSDEDRFTLSGRFSDLLAGDAGDNLVVRARDGLRALLRLRGHEAAPVVIHLEKNLPVASGIGGGSADAAATLRGLQRFWGAHADEEPLAALALSLGADVPMCLRGQPALARGVGEELTPLQSLPGFFMVLGNPLRGVSTPQVFASLTSRQKPPIAALEGSDWMAVLAGLRNDLEPAARALVPEIREISDLLAAHGATLTRMSGSGATCFGLFASMAAAERAATDLRILRPDWYFEATRTMAGS